MLPPTIPTSFVPHPAGAAPRQSRINLAGVFGFFSYGVLGVALALALGVFFYGRILASSQASRDAALAAAETSIDPATVENFVRLHDRLDSGTALLASHPAFSNFFALLETLMPVTVRFTSMHLSFNDAGGVKLEGTGVAKSFNALAAASAAFAADGRIKDAIFSNIVVSSKDSSVSFALTAALDPKLVAFALGASVQNMPVQGMFETSSTTTPLP